MVFDFGSFCLSPLFLGF
uniref:Uncharacterized protein n=1 Tax=Rhizophora mucronata TaxID=61149 RepID=A0A2P2Q2A1_RHIMU